MEQIDPELPVYGVTTMDELISSSMARRRLALFLMSTFAVLAMFLASLGIYGVTAFLVKQRVQEFGIRMALGAQIRDILLLAVRPGLVLVSIGAAAGLVVSMFVTRLMSSLAVRRVLHRSVYFYYGAVGPCRYRRDCVSNSSALCHANLSC